MHKISTLKKSLSFVAVVVAGAMIMGCGSNHTGQKDSPVNDYAEVYKTLVNEYNEKYSGSNNIGFNLIYFDNDDVPELVAGLPGYCVSLYTCVDGEAVTVIPDWAYGAGGNGGYDYCPGAGVIYNVNADMAGAEEYDTYWKWNPETLELEYLNDEELFRRYYDDYNGDGYFDWLDVDEGEYLEEPKYYYGEAEISKEEYEAHCYDGEFEYLVSAVAMDDMLGYLDEISAGKDPKDLILTQE